MLLFTHTHRRRAWALIACLLLASGCTTPLLWGEKVRYQEFMPAKSDRFRAVVLNAHEIAILADSAYQWYGPQTAEQRNHNQRLADDFSGLAFVYRLDATRRAGVRLTDISSISLHERVWLKSDAVTVRDADGHLLVHLHNDTTPLSANLDRVTRIAPGVHAIPVINRGVRFHRSVYVSRGEITNDPSYLYRIPLTPLAVAYDVTVFSVAEAAALVVGPPALFVVVIMCAYSKGCP